MLATTKQIDEKTFGLFIGDREIGRAKLQCDAEFHAHIINTAHDHAIASAEQGAFDEGYWSGHAVGYKEGFEDGKSEAENKGE